MEYKPKTTRDKREYDVSPDKNITNTIKTEKCVAAKKNKCFDEAKTLKKAQIKNMEYKPKTTRDKREYDVSPDKNITNTIKTEKCVAAKKNKCFDEAVERKKSFKTKKLKNLDDK
ncbi:hypothetical protein Glove_22g208 [Diversispora epigaea]|uniref:Uncharacterized protein n=1 Tax=Diversispora epigaea TaxID=1348612 RepID=A0A397JVS8_9GLOM|nr:hypothetical protein Glove_22g208 [Diversispora epigaea]